MPKENEAFTDRVIRRLQNRPSSPERRFVDALTSYLLSVRRMAWDDRRGMFWVLPPHGPPQVALWMPMLPPASRPGA